jgi:MFS family permease
MAGGLLAAIFGPQVNKLVFGATSTPYLGTYLAVIAINLIGMFLFMLLDLPDGDGGQADGKNLPPARSRAELLRNPTILVAIICGMVSFSLMNLVMTATPLAVIGCGYTNANANDIVSAHVLAMFIPSFFTGHLINRFGVTRIISCGLIILGLAGVVALSGIALGNFFVALVLLGIGWNFGFIGATSLLTSAHEPHERGRAQGLNDMMVFGCVTLASLASGGLLNCTGGSAVQGWSAVNLAMVPFLLLAGSALVWLGRQRRQTIV